MKQWLIFMLICVCAIFSLGALNFGGTTTDSVNFGSGTSIDGFVDRSICIWMYPTTQTGGRRTWEKFVTTGMQIIWAGADVNDFAVTVTRAGTDGFCRTSTSFATNAWHFIVFTYDETNGPRVFFGNETTPMAECTYAVGPTVGTLGTDSDAAHSLFVGNNTSVTLPFQGRIHSVAYLNEVLPLGRMEAMRIAHQKYDSVKLYSILGLSGTDCPDLSGNGNHGTVTTATQADGPPQVLLPWSAARKIMQ